MLGEKRRFTPIGSVLHWHGQSVTKLNEGHVPDEVYSSAREEFSEEELIDLTVGVVAINSWNRINVAFRTEAGNYQPGEHAVVAH